MNSARVTHVYPPGSCLSCGARARVLVDSDGEQVRFDCADCGPLVYAPAFDDRGRKVAGYSKPAEAAALWAAYRDPMDDDVPF